jgi:pseudouridine kinase
MLFSQCKFCGTDTVFPFSVVTKKHTIEYLRCNFCDAISLSDKYFLSTAQQHERYKHHNNFLENLGYTQFLGDYLLKTFSFLPPFSVSAILDYGSGPNPALIQLLGLVFEKQGEGNGAKIEASFRQCQNLESCVTYLSALLPRLPKKECLFGWDPFFAPHSQKKQVPLVLCLEVAEHFEQPWDGFAGLADCCCVGGFVAVGTLPLPDSMIIPDDFKKWWYKDDRTHVSFYTEKAMVACGNSCGLKYLGKASPRIFIFQKQEDALSST